MNHQFPFGISMLMMATCAIVATMPGAETAPTAPVLSVSQEAGALPGVYTVRAAGRTTPLFAINIRPNFRACIHPVWNPAVDDDKAQVTNQPGFDGKLAADGKPEHYGWHTGIWYAMAVPGGKFWYDNEAFFNNVVDPPTVVGDTIRWTLHSEWRDEAAQKPGRPARTALIETQRWQVTVSADMYVFDLEQHLQPPTEADVVVPKADYGGLFIKTTRWGYRRVVGLPLPAAPGAPTWKEDIRAKGDKVDPFDKLELRWLGFAASDNKLVVLTMIHPSDPGGAVPWRWQKDHFGPSRCIRETWTIPAAGGENYRYRIVIKAGPAGDWIEGLYDALSKLPIVDPSAALTPTPATATPIVPVRPTP